MANNKEVLMTAEGLSKIEEKLEELKTVRRHDVAERIKQAIAFGDISENAEYDEAKNEQAFIEGEIATLENMLGNVRIIDEDDITTDTVGIGSIVKVLDVEFGEEEEYTLTGSAEADPTQGRISNESPVGIALMGQPVGAEVEVQVPDGLIKLKVLTIRR